MRIPWRTWSRGSGGSQIQSDSEEDEDGDANIAFEDEVGELPPARSSVNGNADATFTEDDINNNTGGCQC